MKRRDALKNIGFAAGFAIAAPSFSSLLQSCTNEPTWIPSYLNKEEQTVLTNLVDIILPKTEKTPSATEVKVPQFMDKYINEVLEDKDQQLIRTSFKKIITELKPSETATIDEVTTEQYTALLDKYLLVKGEVDEERKANPEAQVMTNSEFLGQMKWMTIEAYRTSEQVGETILMYDPVPTTYYCGDLQEISGGKSSSL
ncbi:MAG: gluconate 2-dehydrogenase subunit 3 family protein [Polaribacter sp.]